MSQETETALQKSLDAIDTFRRRMYIGGWVVAAVTLGLYARLAYLHKTTDDLEQLLGGSVAALSFLIAWAAYAIVITLTRTTKRIVRAIELLSRTRS